MIQLGTIVKVTDKTGVVLGQCIKVLGNSCKNIANFGDLILISVKRINTSKFLNVKARLRRRFQRGTIHRGLVVRACVNFRRKTTTFLRFNENAVVLVTKRRVPVSNRVYGPILKEFCMR
jgi:large subunit ribosomal protein L14